MKRDRGRIFAVLIVAFMFALIATHFVVLANATAMDREFTADTLSDERVYEYLNGTTLTATSETEIPRDIQPHLPTFQQLVVRSASQNYFREQVTTNVNTTYDYLRGDRETIVLVVDVDPLLTSVEHEIEAEILQTDPEKLGFERAATLAESEAAFGREREAFRAEQKQRIQNETNETLSDAELEARLEEQMPSIRAELNTTVTAQAAERAPAGLEEPYAEFATVTVGALTTDMTYESYHEEYERSFTELAAAFAEHTVSKLQPSRPSAIAIDIVDQGELSLARQIYAVIQTAVYVLPLVTLSLAVAIVHVSSSHALASFVIGSVVMLVEGVTFTATYIVSTVVLPEIDSGSSEAVVGVVVLENVLEVLQHQSLISLLVGVSFLLLGLRICFEDRTPFESE